MLRPTTAAPVATLFVFQDFPVELWERIFMHMGVEGVLQMRLLSSLCAKIGATVLAPTNYSRLERQRSLFASGGNALHRSEEKLQRNVGEANQNEEEELSFNEDCDDLDKEEEEEDKEGLWHVTRERIISRCHVATLKDIARLSRSKKLWRAVTLCPDTWQALVNALNAILSTAKIDAGFFSSIWKRVSSDKPGDQPHRPRLEPSKELEHILCACDSPLLSFLLQTVPTQFFSKLSVLVRSAKAKTDYGTVAQLALCRALPENVVLAELLPFLYNNCGSATPKDVVCLLSLKHRWCEFWLMDTIKRMIPKIGVKKLAKVAFSESLLPTVSSDFQKILRRQLTSVLMTANFQQLQYLRQSNFDHEEWRSLEAISARYNYLFRHFGYKATNFNCYYLWLYTDSSHSRSPSPLCPPISLSSSSSSSSLSTSQRYQNENKATEENEKEKEKDESEEREDGEEKEEHFDYQQQMRRQEAFVRYYLKKHNPRSSAYRQKQSSSPSSSRRRSQEEDEKRRKSGELNLLATATDSPAKRRNSKAAEQQQQSQRDGVGLEFAQGAKDHSFASSQPERYWAYLRSSTKDALMDRKKVKALTASLQTTFNDIPYKHEGVDTFFESMTSSAAPLNGNVYEKGFEPPKPFKSSGLAKLVTAYFNPMWNNSNSSLQPLILQKICSFLPKANEGDIENLCCIPELWQHEAIFLAVEDRLVNSLKSFETLELVQQLHRNTINFILNASPSKLRRRVFCRLDLQHHISFADTSRLVALLKNPKLQHFILTSTNDKLVHCVKATIKRIISTVTDISELVELLIHEEVKLYVHEDERLMSAVDDKLLIHLVPLANMFSLRLLLNSPLSVRVAIYDAARNQRFREEQRRKQQQHQLVVVASDKESTTRTTTSASLSSSSTSFATPARSSPSSSSPSFTLKKQPSKQKKGDEEERNKEEEIEQLLLQTGNRFISLTRPIGDNAIALCEAICQRLFVLISECERLDDLEDVLGQYDPDFGKRSASSSSNNNNNNRKCKSAMEEGSCDILWRKVLRHNETLQIAMVACLEHLVPNMPREDLTRVPKCPWLWKEVVKNEELKSTLLQQSLLTYDRESLAIASSLNVNSNSSSNNNSNSGENGGNERG
ncbi:hypothetical protein QOT17_008479 [Balamuthia mandrillaris]